MKRIHIFIILLITVALIIVAGLLWTTDQSDKQTSEQQPATKMTEVERQRTEITYTAKAGKTSLEQLKLEADSVITKTSEFGEYVDTIEGHQGGTDGKYWSYYVNDTMSSVGADSYTQKGGEVVTWKFQKL